ncbi:MAG TPA: HdeD family acid-resistance protein [Steroidobacteraceae bacterium]
MAGEIGQMEKGREVSVTRLHLHWKFFLIEGIVLWVLGAVAICVPPLATFGVELLIGWIVLLSGVVGLAMTVRTRGSPGFGWSLLSALIAIAAGAVLLIWPLSGALSLTVILTAFLAFEGIVSVMYALAHRRERTPRWGLMLFSGIVDLVLAAMIFSGLPGTAAWAIGLLVGINMVFGGSALIAMALQARTDVAVTV